MEVRKRTCILDTLECLDKTYRGLSDFCDVIGGGGGDWNSLFNMTSRGVAGGKTPSPEVGLLIQRTYCRII